MLKSPTNPSEPPYFPRIMPHSWGVNSCTDFSVCSIFSTNAHTNANSSSQPCIASSAACLKYSVIVPPLQILPHLPWQIEEARQNPSFGCRAQPPLNVVPGASSLELDLPSSSPLKLVTPCRHHTFNTWPSILAPSCLRSSSCLSLASTMLLRSTSASWITSCLCSA